MVAQEELGAEKCNLVELWIHQQFKISLFQALFHITHMLISVTRSLF